MRRGLSKMPRRHANFGRRNENRIIDVLKRAVFTSSSLFCFRRKSILYYEEYSIKIFGGIIMKIRFRLKLIESKIIGAIVQVLFLVDDAMLVLKMYNCFEHVLKLQHYFCYCRRKIHNECWKILEKSR